MGQKGHINYLHFKGTGFCRFQCFGTSSSSVEQERKNTPVCTFIIVFIKLAFKNWMLLKFEGVIFKVIWYITLRMNN
jgi:hypothetical protein